MLKNLKRILEIASEMDTRYPDELARLLKHYNKIVVFGSFVKGNFGQESDIDVIIVSPNFRDKSIIERAKLTTGVGRELVKRFKIPFDLIYYSDEE